MDIFQKAQQAEYLKHLNATLIALEKILNSLLDSQAENNKLMREVVEKLKRK